MRSVLTKDGIRIPFTEITKFWRNRGSSVATIVDRNDKAHQVDKFEWEFETRRHIVNVIPAQPNTYLLAAFGEQYYLEATDYSPVDMHMIIGWAVTMDGLKPVTVEGVDTGDDDGYAIKRPDGVVEDAHIGIWENTKAYLEHRKNEIKESEARKAAKETTE